MITLAIALNGNYFAKSALKVHSDFCSALFDLPAVTSCPLSREKIEKDTMRIEETIYNGLSSSTCARLHLPTDLLITNIVIIQQLLLDASEAGLPMKKVKAM